MNIKKDIFRNTEVYKQFLILTQLYCFQISTFPISSLTVV
jgi:hypothetical protein